ncbi:MAG TPA: hypothetical protein DCS22_01625 [Flavobacteriaceae bacterium]|nr:hypothetical protein [Flavobacteriaceae bacterium]
MNLTKNFSLNELTKSSTAIRLGIDNTPNHKHLVNMVNVCCHILQPVREHFGRVVTINSGYRSPKLNTAVNGSKTSQHCNGQAADFEIYNFPNHDLANWIKQNLNFDQLILEFYNPEEGPNSGWVHCSYNLDGSNRKKVLTALRINNKTRYKEGLVK